MSRDIDYRLTVSVYNRLPLLKWSTQISSTQEKHDFEPGLDSFARRAVELILERDKSRVDEWHESRCTPLHIAANNDHDECIRILVLSVSSCSCLRLLTAVLGVAYFVGMRVQLHVQKDDKNGFACFLLLSFM